MEQFGVGDVVEEGFDVGVDGLGVTGFMALADAGNGAVDTPAGAVAIAAFEEFFFERAGEMAGDSGFKDAVADRGDHEHAHFAGAGLLFDNDAEQGEGAILIVFDLIEEGFEFFVGVMGEGLDGYAVGAGAAFIFQDALPGIQRLSIAKGRGMLVFLGGGWAGTF